MKEKGPLRSALLYFLLYIGVQAGVLFAMSLAAMQNSNLTQNELFELVNKNVTTMLFVSTAMTILIIFAIAIIRGVKIKKLIGFGSSPSAYICGLAFFTGIFANFWTSIVVTNLGFSSESMAEYEAASNAISISAGSAVTALLTVVILAPILEEIIFRGIILSRLSSVMPMALAITVQALAFGVLHGTFIWVLYAVFCGFTLGYIKHYTGGLLPCILFHIGFNGGTVLLGVLLSATQNPELSITLTLIASGIGFAFGMHRISQYNN